MKNLAIDIIADLAKDTTVEAIRDAIKELLKCASVAAITAAIGATAMPILIPAVALVGAELLVSRSERRDAEAFDTLCGEALGLLDQIALKVEGSAEELAKLVEHKTWVRARMTGDDQAVLARRVASAVLYRLRDLDLATNDRIDGLLVYSETVLYKLDELQKSVEAICADNRKIAETISAKYERSEQDLRAMLSDREAQICTLEEALRQVRCAADSGDSEAERAIRVARATGDAKLLFTKIDEISRTLRNRQIDRRRAEDERRKEEEERRKYEDLVYLARAQEGADLAYLLGKIDDATYWVNEILSIDANNLAAINRLGTIYQLRGNLSEAQHQYRRLLDLAPQDASWRAIAYGNLNDLARVV